jgi:DNA-binding PadR family transcriptional regulator
MRAVNMLGNQAYGVPVRRLIMECTGRDLSMGSVYVSLDRLERKGYVSSVLTEPTHERGGRSKRVFQITAPGVCALENSEAALSALGAFRKSKEIADAHPCYNQQNETTVYG